MPQQSRDLWPQGPPLLAGRAPLTLPVLKLIPRASHPSAAEPAAFFVEAKTMKVRSSIKSLKGRHRDCKVVRRKGRIYVINKTDPRYKAKQG